MSKLTYAKLATLALFLLITLPLIITYNSDAHRDNDIVLGYALIALTFPTGLLAIGFVTEALDILFSIQLPPGRLEMILTSVGFLIVGYLQWFVVLPILWRLLRKLVKGGTETTPKSSG